MKPVFSAEDEAFRSEVRNFLAGFSEEELKDEWTTGLDGFFASGDERAGERVTRLYRALGAKGWLSLAWPPEYGGLGRSPVQEFILWDEMAYARAARPPLGPGIVAKTIIAHGTPDQRRRYLPGLRAGELGFSLGYSEPEAGSDLARVRTRARRVGDHYIVTGEKRWTSSAHLNDYLWLLCRTGTLEERSRGLTILIVDLRAPGVTISPIPLLDGGRLNEVHLDEVEVPVIDRVGPEGGAWKLVGEALATERHVQFPPLRLRRDLEDLVAFAATQGLLADPVVNDRLERCAVTVDEVQALGLLLLEKIVSGETGALEAAASKLAAAELCQELARAALDLGAPEALVRGTAVEFLWRQSILETIGGGTSEIMRGIVARTALGLGGGK